MTITIKAEDSLEVAAETIASGGIVAYPTETTYGLAIDPFNKEALDRLFSLKGRSDKNPISLIVSDAQVVERLAEDIPRVAKRLMERFWPGPLTIVFKAASTIPEAITAGTGKIGLRVSSSSVASKLARDAGGVITATSANPSGEDAAMTAKEVDEYFGENIDVIIDGGTLRETTPSTVVDITTGKIIIIRQGAIPTKDLEANP